MNPKTAILFFARTPSAEAASKPIFLRRNANNRHFYSGLNCHALSVAGGSGFPVFSFDESQQTGQNFGQRLANAFQKIFNDGYGKVIAIGNDCPMLTPAMLLKADDSLSANGVVIGPNNRGGVYLLGLTLQAFEKEALEHVAWQSPRLISDLIGLFNNNESAVGLLSPLHDINNISDVYLTRYTLSKNHPVAILVQELLYRRPSQSAINGLHIFEELYAAAGLRAPPSIIA